MKYYYTFRIYKIHIVYESEVIYMLNLKIGDKIYNFGRMETITKIVNAGSFRKYYTETRRGSENFFTSKDLSEHSIKSKRVASPKDHDAVRVLMTE